LRLMFNKLYEILSEFFTVEIDPEGTNFSIEPDIVEELESGYQYIIH
jgi:hypothetical protein